MSFHMAAVFFRLSSRPEDIFRKLRQAISTVLRDFPMDSRFMCLPQAEVDSQRIAATQDGSEVTAENSTETASGQKSAGEDSGEAETASSTEQKIDLNTADVSQLTTTGVGESKALAIIAYREENGPFTSAEDIMNVPGIKEGTYEKIKDKIAIK